MPSTPKLSVIMPVYNAGAFLFSAIDSILSQTFTDFEFIIIDDGSSDNSLTLIKSFAEKDSRIYVLSRENRGLVYTLNEGIGLAKGEYIARMDSDDICHPERFSKQVEFLSSQEVDICGSHYFVIDSVGEYLDNVIVPLTKERILITLGNTVPFAHPSVMFKTNITKKLTPLYDTNSNLNCEDYNLWTKLYNHGFRFGNVDQFLFYYRELPTGLSKINNNLGRERNIISSEFVTENAGLLIESLLNDAPKVTKQRRDYIVTVLVMVRTIGALKLLIYLKKFSVLEVAFGIYRFFKQGRFLG